MDRRAALPLAVSATADAVCRVTQGRALLTARCGTEPYRGETLVLWGKQANAVSRRACLMRAGSDVVEDVRRRFELDPVHRIRKGQSMHETSEPAGTPGERAQTSAVSVERHKAVSRRWIEVFNERDDATEADVRTANYIAHAPASLEPAPLDSQAWRRFLSDFVDAFPDLRITVEDAVGEGDLVAQRVHFEGTHMGEFQGLPPTHRRVSFSGLELNRFVDGRVEEHWFQMDSLSLLQQIGLAVVPGPRLLPRLVAHQAKKLRSSLTRSAAGA